MTIPELAAILMLAFRAAAQDYCHSPDSTPASYRILDAGPFGSLQKKADDASIGGYDVAAGFERVVVMRKARAGERSVTTTVLYASPDRREIERVEQRLNDAAAAGFRLVPNAMLTSLHLAMMEKRAGTPPPPAHYKLLVFTARDRIYLIPPGLMSEFDADAIDERLSSMAVAGYRPIALATRVVDDHLTRRRRQLIVFLENSLGAPVITNVREAARRYRVVIAFTEAALEKRLNEAAATGYHLLTTVSEAFPEAVAIVEKLPAATVRRSYRVLVSRTVSKFSDEFARAAAAGWAPHPSGLLDPSGGYRQRHAVLLVVERDETTTAGEVLVLGAKRSSTLAGELNRAAAAGFELLTGGRSRDELVLLLGRPGRDAARRGISHARTNPVPNRTGASLVVGGCVVRVAAGGSVLPCRGGRAPGALHSLARKMLALRLGWRQQQPSRTRPDCNAVRCSAGWCDSPSGGSTPWRKSQRRYPPHQDAGSALIGGSTSAWLC